jgi:hypothetical protein
MKFMTHNPLAAIAVLINSNLGSFAVQDDRNGSGAWLIDAPDTHPEYVEALMETAEVDITPIDKAGQ